MQPLRLDLEGFGTFRAAQTLDLSDAEYFALVGPTGSGKSTIIDALCFALYGTAPRWRDERQIHLALAPSTTRGSVCLTFRSGGRTYAALRVVVRNARGQVGTKQVRLVRLADGADLGGSLADLLDQEAEELANGPAAVRSGVVELLGLTWDHFVQCVVLPQGDFAKFLGAPRRQRQDLLVNLLGLGVYDRVATAARRIASDEVVRRRTLDGQLERLADATDEAVAEAQLEADRLAGLRDDLAALVEPWTGATRALADADDAVADLQRRSARLRAVAAPPGLAELGSERSASEAAVATARDRLGRAQAAAESADAAAEEAGDPRDWAGLVQAHTALADQRAQRDACAADLAVSRESAATAATAAELAAATTARARADLDAVRTAHAADDLARHLEAGEACPVCLQDVAVVPDRPAHAGIAEAEAALAAAVAAERRTSAEATTTAGEVARLEGRLHDLEGRQAEMTGALEGRDDLATAQARHRAAVDAAAAAATARQELRAAVGDQRRAEQALAASGERWTAAGAALHDARQAVAAEDPPPTTGDHAADWTAVTAWAAARRDEVDAQVAALREEQRRRATEAETRRDAVRDALSAAGVPAPSPLTEVAVSTAVGSAVTAAGARADRLRERVAEAADLRAQVAASLESERVHKTLGQLLDATHFERWIVEEALTGLVAEASRTLLELSGGQFEITTDDEQELLVVDHNDAGSTRPVTTLSGGETFQASLALALALSTQVASLSASGAGRLDTILLDEGFGTLDPSTLDVVAGTLEALAGGGGRTVGVITHVAALAERIPTRFQVAREGSSSTVTPVGA
ncbi:AAA family ATPase [Nocardioides litoris]|uniref:AAA family ATPase n=1 Tax=Nocardioides litoris TaxID=1926648 RepID=UPI0011219AA8|nr:SMC family ATPase [Nocardioides litoris]